MNQMLPKEVLGLADKFKQANFQLYLVGGIVRDLLLMNPQEDEFIEHEVKDWDFTTDATPEEILKIIPDGYYNNQFGTVGLSTDIGIFEITTMRKESGYSDSRHPTEIAWTKNIEEDLARRDFTVNAMAILVTSGKSLESREDDLIQNPNDWQLIDPFNGQADLKAKIIRSVGDPAKRFNEDALRLMRAIRFATKLNFKIEEQTQTAIQQNAELIKNISWERIRDELFKILAADDPYRGVTLLRDVGLLKFILPEVERCFGVKQEGPKHDRVYDIGVHSLLSLKECPSKSPLIRFAALIHDVGKPDTYRVAPDGNVTFYGHETVGAKIAKKIAERLRLSRKEIEKIEKLVRWHMFTVDENQTDSAIRRFITNVGLENVDDMIDLRIADRLGGGTMTAKSWRMEEFRKRIDQVLEKPFSISDLKVNGTDVMEITGLKPGKAVGEILQKLFEEVVEDSEKNNREFLVKQIGSIKGKV